MFTLINGSPKKSNSNSMHFLEKISFYLDNYAIFDLKKDQYKDILENINKSDSIIIAFPLYVDSPNSITLSFLDYIIDNNINLNGKTIYPIVNCGFREGKHNITAINIIRSWCAKTESTYGGSIMIGAGEIVGKEKYKIVSKTANKKLRYFAKIIKEKKIAEDIITTMDLFNNKLFCIIANYNWNIRGKKNNLSSLDLKEK